MSTHLRYSGPLLALLALCCGIFVTSCRTKPRSLPPLSTPEIASTAKQYGEMYVNSPEMFPRELSMPERLELLHLNWAMMKAAESGKLTVRILAPPLQLTGDPNVDEAATYNVLLVADDLLPHQSFLDVYEVRVGPPSVLMTVRPASAAESLAAADSIYAEEQLTRLRLDSQTLKASQAFATNYAPTVSNYLAEAGTAFTNQLQKLSGLTNKLVSTLETESNSVFVLSNQIANATSTIANLTAAIKKADPKAPTYQTDTNKLATAQASLITASRDLLTHQSKLDDTESKLTEVNASQTELRTRFDSVKATVDTLLRAPASFAASIKAVEVLQSFWQNQLKGNDELAKFSTELVTYHMSSAAVVTFRAQALRGLQQVTIDVIRKNREAPKPAGQPGQEASDVIVLTLNRIKTVLQDTASLLLADNRTLNSESRSRRLTVEFERLEDLSGDLQGEIILRNAGHTERAAPIGLAGLSGFANLPNPVQAFREDIAGVPNPSTPKTPHNAAPPEKLEASHSHFAAIKPNTALEVSLNISLSQIELDLNTLSDGLRAGDLDSRTQRMRLLGQTADLRQHISTALTLATAQDNGTLTNVISPRPLDNVEQDAKVKMIERGDLAVYRLNVLRGVVSTTAYLLADDDSAQLFGQTFADQFYAAQVTFRNQSDKPILIYGNTMRLVVRMDAPSDGLSEDGQFVRYIWWAMYEPLDYDSVRRMLESEQSNTWQEWAAKGLDLAQMAGGAWAAFTKSTDVLKAIGVFGAFTPKLRDLLESDLKRYALNFKEKGLNNIEEIPEEGTLTRYVFLPKGPIYGSYAHDKAVANGLPTSSEEGRWNPFKSSSRDFGKMALEPAYIHDIRREEVYVEGKRILASDPLTPIGGNQ